MTRRAMETSTNVSDAVYIMKARNGSRNTKCGVENIRVAT